MENKLHKGGGTPSQEGGTSIVVKSPDVVGKKQLCSSGSGCRGHMYPRSNPRAREAAISLKKDPISSGTFYRENVVFAVFEKLVYSSGFEKKEEKEKSFLGIKMAKKGLKRPKKAYFYTFCKKGVFCPLLTPLFSENSQFWPRFG